MSSASTTRTIKFISKAGTYMATIMCPDGDLFQYWDGTGADQTVFPNFATMQPKLNFICTSSRVAEGIATIASMRYYFGGTEITFNASGYSTGLFGDGTANGSYFKKYAADGSTNLYPGLQILKNIAALASYLPVTIKMVATIYYGTQEDSISADYTIPIQQKAQFAGKVTIVAGDNKSFVISSKGDSCILQAKAYSNEGALSVGLTYKWEQFDPSAAGNVDGWKLLGSSNNDGFGNSATLTVTESMIDTYGEFRLTVKRNGSFYGMDVQGVVDKSDPYDIDPHPSPEDETIDEDTSSSRDHVTYTPVLVTRGGTAVSPNPLYYFLVRDAAGVVLNKYRDGNAAVNGSDPMELSTNAMASYTVTREQCQAGGGDISITIQAAS
jgi:hypothetical protein